MRLRIADGMDGRSPGSRKLTWVVEEVPGWIVWRWRFAREMEHNGPRRFCRRNSGEGAGSGVSCRKMRCAEWNTKKRRGAPPSAGQGRGVPCGEADRLRTAEYCAILKPVGASVEHP
jgi:hypothetical protein